MTNIANSNADKKLEQILLQMKNKQYDSADKACQHLLISYPKNRRAWQLQMQVQLITKQSKAALHSVDQILRLSPNDIPTKLQKIKCLHACANFNEAKDLAMELYTLAPQNPASCGALGACLSSLKLYPQALQLYKNLVLQGYKSASLFYNIATVERFLGNMQAAEAALNKAIEVNPHDYEAIALRSDIITQSSTNNHIPYLQQLIKSGIKDAKNSVKINYALAKELEDVGEYEASFRALKGGADTRRSNMQYQADKEIHTIERIIQTFDKAWFTRTQVGLSQHAPIFIIGLPRTGTTLLERILESHHEVTSAGELNNFATILVEQCQQLNKARQHKVNDLVVLSQDLNFDQLGQAYTQSVAELVPEEDTLIDKMPLNFLYAGLIHKALPKAKIIHVRRDPIDTCYAMYKKLFKNSYAFSYDLTEIANYYVAYSRLMKHWHCVMPGVIYDIKYEDLVEDTQGQTESLLAYCDLPWQEQVLRFYDNKSGSTTASAAQVRQPIYKHSVAKWRRYENELAPLIKALKLANIESSEGLMK